MSVSWMGQRDGSWPSPIAVAKLTCGVEYSEPGGVDQDPYLYCVYGYTTGCMHKHR